MMLTNAFKIVKLFFSCQVEQQKRNFDLEITQPFITNVSKPQVNLSFSIKNTHFFFSIVQLI